MKVKNKTLEISYKSKDLKKLTDINKKKWGTVSKTYKLIPINDSNS